MENHQTKKTHFIMTKNTPMFDPIFCKQTSSTISKSLIINEIKPVFDELCEL